MTGTMPSSMGILDMTSLVSRSGYKERDLFGVPHTLCSFYHSGITQSCVLNLQELSLAGL